MFLGNELNIEDTLILNRKQFDELCRPLIMRSIAIVKRALENAKISADQIDEVFISLTFPSIQTSPEKFNIILII